MYNWWQRVSTPIGRNVAQFKTTNDLNIVARIDDAVSTGEVAALLTPANAQVTVVGSSLGGHLAMAFAGLFPEATASAVAFNSPGFGDIPLRLGAESISKTLFTALGGSVPAIGNPLITNVLSSEANNAGSELNLIAGFPSGNFPGFSLSIPIENQFNSDVPDPKFKSWNHDQRQVTDVLTVFDMLQRLDPTLTPQRFGVFLRMAASGENRSLENLVDSVESFLGVNRIQLPAANEYRDKLHGAVQSLVGGSPQAPNPNVIFQSLAGKVALIPLDNNLAGKARSDFASFVALETLAAFSIKPVGAAGSTALDSLWLSPAWSDTYQAWLTDNALIAEGKRAVHVTESWLKDRAVLLAGVIYRNPENISGPLVPTPSLGLKAGRYLDTASGTDFTVGLETNTTRQFLFGADGADELQGRFGEDHLYGGNGDDVLSGGGANDYLEAGSGNDVLTGGTGSDTLSGGTGTDIYLFGEAFGKDTITDIDGLGFLNIDGRSLAGGKASGTPNLWIGDDGAGHVLRYAVHDNKQSATGKQLVVARAGDSANTVTIDNFDLAAATGAAGYLGIRLDNTQAVFLALASTSGAKSPYQGLPFDPGAIAGLTELAESSAVAFTVYMRVAAKLGETVTLALSNLGHKFKALVGGVLVAANGAVLQLRQGQTEVSFTLVQDGEVTGDVSTALSVSYNGPGPVVASNAWTVAVEDSGTAGQSIQGDGMVGLRTSATTIWRDGRIVVQAGEAAYVVGADGNLTAGPGTLVLDNVIYGGSGHDKILGVAGNDALDGGAGNDELYGEQGDDLIAGGDGSNSLQGGSGNDFILGSGALSATLQQWGPNDLWQAPSGVRVLGRGPTWGVYEASPDLVIWSGAVNPGAGRGSNAIDAGDGDDHVIGGAGDDRIDGGAGSDKLDGMGGADAIDGGSGNDTIRADGIVLAGYFNSSAPENHGKDFADGGSGDDHVEGGGDADVLYGGTGNDEVFGDTGGRTDSGFFVRLERHGADYLDGGEGNDYLEGGGGDDSLYGGVGMDVLWGDTAAANIVGNGSGQSALDLMALARGNDYLDGEEGDDSLAGGAGDDLLLGGSGNDRLWGDESSTALAGLFHGADTLDGEEGDDFLVGGGGDDTLYGGEGNDHLVGDDELAVLAADFHGNDYLDGGAGNDALTGGGGADTLFGGSGNDVLTGDHAAHIVDAAPFDGADYLDGEEGDDHLNGGGADDVLIGGSGDDRLDGGTGADFMDGGAGNDTYWVDDIADTVVERLAGGADTVFSSVGITLPDNVENLVLSNDSGIHATGNAQANLLQGGAGSNTLRGLGGNDSLVGGAGADVMIGGEGDDIYEVDDAGDTVIEAAGEGTDVVRTSVDHTLGAHVERVTALGTAHLVLTGNTLANDITGNGGNNLLTGAQGDDYLAGGGGNDVFVFNAGDGRDLIDSLDTSSATDVLRFGAGIVAADIVGLKSGNNLVLKVRGTQDQVTFANHYAASTGQGSAATDYKIDRVEFANGATWDQAAIQAVVDRIYSNRRPEVGGVVPALKARAGETFAYAIASNVITDPDSWDLVTYSAKLASGGALPAWLSFDAASRTFRGTPSAPDVGNLDLVLWGTDSYGMAAGAAVSLQVSPPNRAPVLAVPFLDQTVELGRPLYYGLSGREFSDPDQGDRLTYSATLADGSPLPTWLTFAANIPAFQGEPLIPGSVAVQVTAADSRNLQASALFTVRVTGTVLDGTAGSDVLLGNGGVELLRGWAGDDQIAGGAGNDYLVGGTGNDTLAGGDGSDTYFFERGFAQDTVVNADSDLLGGNADKIRFDAGIKRSDVMISRSGDDLVLEIIGTGDRVTIQSFLALNGSTTAAVETIQFADRSMDIAALLSAAPRNEILGTAASFERILGTSFNDVIHGMEGADRLLGGAGNDILYGGLGLFRDELLGDIGDDILDGQADGYGDVLSGELGADIYVFGRGYGADELGIIEPYGGPVLDHVVFRSDVAAADLVLTREGYLGMYLRATVRNTADSVLMPLFHSVVTQVPTDVFRFALDGSAWGLNDIVSRISLTGGAGADSLYGYDTSDDVISGGNGDDQLWGMAGRDNLSGGGGADTLEGGTGSDKLYGGDGNDILNGDATGETNAPEAISTLVIYAKGTVCEGIWPTMEVWLSGVKVQAFNVASPDFAPYTVSVPAGTKAASVDLVFTNDAYRPDLGQDRNLFVDRIIVNGRTLGAKDVGAILDSGTGSAALDGFNTAASAGVLASHGAIRFGLGGNDLMDGGAGADVMAGGQGNDQYMVDDAADVIIESAGAGHDLVRSSMDYTLGNHLEDLELTGTTAIHAVGNSGSNSLRGNTAANRLDGAAGADFMAGGPGNDTYVADNEADVAYELANEGVDLVLSTATFTLGANVENLQLLGTAAINGAGNGLNNLLTGNSAANVLGGGAGDDVLNAGAGSDKLYGGEGSDVLNGDDATEPSPMELVRSLVIHAKGSLCEGIWPTMEIWLAGTKVQSIAVASAEFAAYAIALGAGVTASSVDIVFTNDAARADLGQDRNLFVDRIEVNGRTLSARDMGAILDYGVGAAALDGLNTQLSWGTLGSHGAIRIGLGGNDYLDGGAGADAMAGGYGNDVYLVDDARDRISELPHGGHDIVRSSADYTLDANLEDLELTGAAAINGTGNEGSNTLRGNAAANRLDGGAGADMLMGGLGNDTYVLDHVSDAIYEAVDAGMDTAVSYASHTLESNVENLTLAGTAAISGTGNAQANMLLGNAAANVLAGAAGNDTLHGEEGNDRLLGGEGSDVLVGDAAAENGAPQSIQSLVVYARGTICEGAWPTMEVWLAGVKVQSFQVSSPDFSGYVVTVPPGTLVSSVDLAFVNDAYRPDLGQDRNLFVDRIEVNGRIVSAKDSGAILDSGTGATAFDGWNTTVSAGVLATYGAIRIGLSGGDLLDGGTGADSMAGGYGNDVYMVDDAADLAIEQAGAGHDVVRSSVNYMLGANLEDLELLGAQAINAWGNGGNNTLRGNNAANLLGGGAGTDALFGGSGDDTYLLGRGDGADTVFENDATAGNMDTARFGDGIAAEQLWFRRSGNALDVTVIGTADRLSIANWYLGDGYHVEQFKTSNGMTLLDSQVQNLVNAMAAFAPPAMGQSHLSTTMSAQLMPVIAANWQAAPGM